MSHELDLPIAQGTPLCDMPRGYAIGNLQMGFIT